MLMASLRDLEVRHLVAFDAVAEGGHVRACRREARLHPVGDQPADRRARATRRRQAVRPARRPQARRADARSASRCCVSARRAARAGRRGRRGARPLPHRRGGPHHGRHLPERVGQGAAAGGGAHARRVPRGRDPRVRERPRRRARPGARPWRARPQLRGRRLGGAVRVAAAVRRPVRARGAARRLQAGRGAAVRARRGADGGPARELVPAHERDGAARRGSRAELRVPHERQRHGERDGEGRPRRRGDAAAVRRAERPGAGAARTAAGAARSTHLDRVAQGPHAVARGPALRRARSRGVGRCSSTARCRPRPPRPPDRRSHGPPVRREDRGHARSPVDPMLRPGARAPPSTTPCSPHRRDSA